MTNAFFPEKLQSTTFDFCLLSKMVINQDFKMRSLNYLSIPSSHLIQFFLPISEKYTLRTIYVQSPGMTNLATSQEIKRWKMCKFVRIAELSWASKQQEQHSAVSRVLCSEPIPHMCEELRLGVAWVWVALHLRWVVSLTLPVWLLLLRLLLIEWNKER